MPESLSTLPASASSLEQASQWLLLIENHPEYFDEFDQWLHSDPEHLQAWAQVNRAWSGLGGQTPTTTRHWPQSTAATPLAPALARRTRRSRKPLLAAACFGAWALCAVIFLAPSLRADYSTATAQTKSVQLEDGSSLTLAPQTAINVVFNDAIRKVTLIKGEVFFDVAHDANKPFEVDSNSATVRVLGTAFDVAQSEAGLKVEVREGTVGVTTAGQPHRLPAGQRLWIDHASGQVSQSAVAPEEVAGWIDGPQFFENASLAQVVEQLRRYQLGWIVITDPALAEKRVTGLYDMRDPQHALQALVAPLGGQIRHYSGLMTVVRAK